MCKITISVELYALLIPKRKENYNFYRTYESGLIITLVNVKTKKKQRETN